MITGVGAGARVGVNIDIGHLCLIGYTVCKSAASPHPVAPYARISALSQVRLTQVLRHKIFGVRPRWGSVSFAQALIGLGTVYSWSEIR
jgi:hypothetical protein